MKRRDTRSTWIGHRTIILVRSTGLVPTEDRIESLWQKLKSWARQSSLPNDSLAYLQNDSEVKFQIALERGRGQTGEEVRLSKDTKVAIAILNWNGARLTERCIDALKNSDYGPLEVIVVDNGSTDGSANSIAERYPEVTLIRNSTNLGFAEGSNQAIRYAMEKDAGYILLLNNDAMVGQKTISRLVETARAHGNKVAVSPKIYNGFEQTRLWFVYGKVNLWAGVFSNPAYNAPATAGFDLVLPMEYVVGCCVLIPRAVIRAVGGFDERFFAYCEDLDWSLRARQAGFSLVCDTRAELWHYVSSTGARNPAKVRYLMTRNHLWTMRRHATTCQFAVFALVFYPARCLLRLAKAIKHTQWECIPAEIHGALDGFLDPVSSGQPVFAVPARDEEGD